MSDLPRPGIEPVSPALATGLPRKSHVALFYQSTVKAIEHGADGHLCFLKESSPAFELEFHPVSEELNPPLGWIENLSVAVADWGMH